MDEITQAIKHRFEEALTFFKNGKIHTAEAICREILHVRQNEPHTLQLLGLIAIAHHNYHDAITHLKESLLELPDDPICHHNLASAYNMAGHFSEAEKHYLKVLALNPEYVEAYFNLVFIADLNQQKSLIGHITEMLYQPSLSSANRMLLHYAAGKYYHANNDFELAFTHFKEANKPLAESFNLKEYQDLVAATIKTFNTDLFFRFKAAGDRSTQPAFIVGLPTSGVTLIDNLLCYHPEITSIKANTDFFVLSKKLSQIRPGHAPYPECVAHLSQDQIKNLAKVYLEQLEKNFDKHYVINDFAINFLYIGLIKLLFPNARIIHIKRAPMDACLACYFTLLQPHCEFSHSLENIAEFYKGYDAIMQHWTTLFTNDLLTISLENLLFKPEPTMKSVLDFLQLPWNENCTNALLLEKGCHYLPGFSSQYLQDTGALQETLTPFIKSYSL